jgi:hypothetical protein
MVDVRFPSDARAFRYGYFLGLDDHFQGFLFCVDGLSDHPICSYKMSAFEIRGSRGIKPKTLTVGDKLIRAIQGKRDPMDLYESTTWPVDMEMAAPEDWTNNFAMGEKVYITCRGSRERVTVVTCFRDYVAFRWPVGTLDCRPAHEVSSEHGEINTDIMLRIQDITREWGEGNSASPALSAAAVSAIRKALK